MVPSEEEDVEEGGSTPTAPEDVPPVSDDDTGMDLMLSGGRGDLEGVDPSPRERVEAGLQDTLDLRDWKMPAARDYFWYLFVYTVLITLAVLVIYRYRMLWAYVLWGGYLATMLVLAALIVRSMNYRRGTYSKGFNMSTLELQQAIDEAVEDVGLKVELMEEPEDAFLRPMIAIYRLRGVAFTVNVEGRPHLKRKVVRVGRFPTEEDLERGHSFIDSLDDHAEKASSQRRSRSLFHEEGAY
jgi:hypothetical protein